MTTLQYEPGMRIIYDPTSMRVTVCFRGRSRKLDGLFVSSAAAKRAGEAYCRAAGWNPEATLQFGRSLLIHRRDPTRHFER